LSTFTRFVQQRPLRRLALAGLMVTATVTAAQATAATQAAAQATAAYTTTTGTAGCGPTYNTQTATATAPWPGASVPWGSVGKGWILGTVAVTEAGEDNGPQTLYLVSPKGQRYKLGPAPGGAYLDDWSDPGLDALFLAQPNNSDKATIDVLNLKTGQVNGFSVYSGGGNFISASFTRPSAQGILVLASASASGGYLPVQRYSLTGTRQECYPNSFPGAGSGAWGYTESPAGGDIVVDTQNGLEVMSNAGQLVRFLKPPHGFSSCGTLNWWSSQTVLVQCSDQSVTELWAFPLSGARPTQVSTKGQSSTFLGAWRLPSGTYAQEAACGSSWLERLNSNGTGTQLLIPGAKNAGNVVPLGTYGNEMPLWVTGGCDGHTPYSKVDWYNPTTNAATTVLGASAGGGFVSDAILFPVS
jgi:hypothetical protein